MTRLESAFNKPLDLEISILRQSRNPRQISDFRYFRFQIISDSKKEELRFDDEEIAKHERIDTRAVEAADGVAHVAYERLTKKVERGIQQHRRR